MVQKCPIFVNVHNIENVNAGDRWSKKIKSCQHSLWTFWSYQITWHWQQPLFEIRTFPLKLITFYTKGGLSSSNGAAICLAIWNLVCFENYSKREVNWVEENLKFKECSHSNMFDYLYLVIYRIPKAIFMALFCWSHFLYYVKCWNVKRYPFANVKLFDIWCGFVFCYLDGANSIKTDFRTCNLWTN